MTLGVAVLSVALRSYQTSFAQKAGALGILIASFLAVYFVTGSWLSRDWSARSAGCFCPGWKFSRAFARCVCRRRKRSGRRARLRPMFSRRFDEISHEIESEGFAHVNDAGWDWEDYRQFFRLFYKEEDRSQATICLNEQHDLSFYYLRISSRAKNGIIWTTWNYPLSYGLKLTPQFRINRQRPDQSFWQLYQSHREFLAAATMSRPSVIDPLDEDRIQMEVENDLRDQIAHNIKKGVLKQTADGEVRYSWRGMVYLWCQFLLDLVRL